MLKTPRTHFVSLECIFKYILAEPLSISGISLQLIGMRKSGNINCWPFFKSQPNAFHKIFFFSFGLSRLHLDIVYTRVLVWIVIYILHAFVLFPYPKIVPCLKGAITFFNLSLTYTQEEKSAHTEQLENSLIYKYFSKLFSSLPWKRKSFWSSLDRIGATYLWDLKGTNSRFLGLILFVR